MSEDRKKSAAAITPTVLPPEALDALKQGQVDVNVLLVQVTNKVNDPHEVLAMSKQVLDLAKDFEHQRVEDFTKRANAVIDVKTRDPDEVDKRANNAMRRRLKALIAGLGVTLIGGGIYCVLQQASIVATGLMLSGGIFAIALLAMLASGESVTSNDIVKVLSAVRNVGQDPNGANGKKGRR